jgi:hypothetical protein
MFSVHREPSVAADRASASRSYRATTS